MPLYASHAPYVWHKFESHHQLSYSTTPTFVPPTPPVLVPPTNPFAPVVEPEPEPKASDEEKKDGPSEQPTSEECPAPEPGMCIASI